MPIAKSSSSFSAALAADAAIGAYLRALADRRAAELTANVADGVGGRRWSVASPKRERYQRVAPIREAWLERAVSLRGEPRVAQTRGAR